MEDGGPFLLVTRDPGGGCSYEQVCHAIKRHTTGTVRLKETGGAARDVLTIACFDLPRNGCNWWWSLPSILATLEITRRSDTTGEMLQKYLPTWEKHAAGLQLRGYLRSSQYQNDRQKHGTDDGRVLKFISCSSPALLARLVKWCSCKPGNGGLRQKKEIDAARDLFSRLVGLAVGGGGFAVGVFTDGAIVRHAMGHATGTDPVILRASATGVVNLEVLLAKVMLFPILFHLVMHPKCEGPGANLFFVSSGI